MVGGAHGSSRELWRPRLLTCPRWRVEQLDIQLGSGQTHLGIPAHSSPLTLASDLTLDSVCSSLK